MRINLFKKIAVLSLLGLGIGGLATSCEPTTPVVVVKTGTVELQFDSNKGTVVADKTEGNEGDTITLTVTPNAGYSIDQVKANGVVLAGPNYAFELQEGTNTVVATFTKDPTISFQASAQAFKAHLTYTLTATVNDSPVRNPDIRFTDNSSGKIQGSASNGTLTFKATEPGNFVIQATAYENAQASTAFVTESFNLTVVRGEETYALVLDTANVKKEYKQGEAFTIEGLGIKKEFSVDGTKVGEESLTTAEVNVSVAVGTVFTEVGPVEVTVSDVEEVASAAKYTVSVAEDKEWQLKTALEAMKANGYKEYYVTSSGGVLTDIVSPSLRVTTYDLQTYHAYENATSSSGSAVVWANDVTFDAQGRATAVYTGSVKSVLNNASFDAVSRGVYSAGLWSDLADNDITALTFDTESNVAAGPAFTYTNVEEGGFSVTAMKVLGLGKYVGDGFSFYRLYFRGEASLLANGLVQVQIKYGSAADAVTTTLATSYFAPLQENDPDLATFTNAIAAETSFSVTYPEVLTNAIDAVAANNATLVCDDADYYAYFNPNYTVYEDIASGDKEGYFQMPAGKADETNVPYNENAYNFKITGEEVEIPSADPEGEPTTEVQYSFEVGDDEEAPLADVYYARLNSFSGFNRSLEALSASLCAESFWTPLTYQTDPDTGEISFSYGQWNTGYGSGYGYLNFGATYGVWGSANGVFGVVNAGLSYASYLAPLSMVLTGTAEADGTITSLSLEANTTYLGNTGFNVGVDFYDLGLTEDAQLEYFVAGIADYVEPTPDPDPDPTPDPDPDPDPDPTPDPDPDPRALLRWRGR